MVQVDYLAHPFETDCIEYTPKQSNPFWRKSQTDCKLEVMKLKELEKCGHNYYWKESLLGQGFVLDQIRRSNNNYLLLNCSVKVDQILLKELCKIECTSHFFSAHIQSDENEYARITSLVSQIDIIYEQISYSPAMDMVSYLSAFGGNISIVVGVMCY